MKRLLQRLLPFILLLPVSSCSDLGDCFKGTGPLTTEERSLPKITYLELHNNVDVVYHYDSVYHLRVTAGENLIDKISTTVDGERLVIKNKNKCNWVRSFDPKLVVEVWAPYLEEILVENASGDVTFADSNTVYSFMFNSYGSIGTYTLKMNSAHAYLKDHTGPADMRVTGKSTELYIWNAGDGKLDALHLDVENATVHNRGSNSVYVNATHYLECYLTSIGNIYYTGHPTEISSAVESSGKLIPY